MGDEPKHAGASPGSEAGYRGAVSLVGAAAGVRFLSLGTSAVAGAATVALALRLLGPTSYGRLAFALAAVALVTALGRLGMGLGTAQTVASVAADSQKLARTVRGALTLASISGLVSGAVVAAFTVAGPFGTGMATRMVMGASLGLLLLGNNVAWGVYSVARGLGRIVVMEALGLVVPLAQLATVVALWLAGVADIRAVALGFGAAGVLGMVASAAVARVLLPHPSRLFVVDLPAARSMLAVLAPFAVAGLAVQLIAQFDVFVLGLFGTKPQVAQYQPTLKLTDALLQIMPYLVIGAYVPAATRLFRRGDHKGFRDLYLIATKLGYVAAFPAILALAAFPEALLHALYGARFPARSSLVWILLAGYGVNLALGLNVVALVSVGDRRRVAWVNLAGLATMVVMAFALIPALGPTGGALATACSYLVWNAAASTALFRSTGVHPFRRDVVLTVLSSLPVMASGLVVRTWVRPEGLLQSVALTAGLTALWLVLLAALRAVRWDEFSHLSLLRARGARRGFLAEPEEPPQETPADFPVEPG